MGTALPDGAWSGSSDGTPGAEDDGHCDHSAPVNEEASKLFPLPRIPISLPAKIRSARMGSMSEDATINPLGEAR
jgi:hypothetical protein